MRAPELPELEALARSLDATVTGREIASVIVRSPSLLKTYLPPINQLVGDALVRVRRRGKWLLFDTRAERTLVVHLKTGGRLRRTEGRAAPSRTDGMVIRFADTADLRVTEIGSRKQAAVHLATDGGAALIAQLGPQPLAPAFGVSKLASVLSGPNRQLKLAKVDQRTLAGIRNAWSDEVLHPACLSPLMPTSRRTPEQIAALHVTLRGCLTGGNSQAGENNCLEKARAEHRPYLRVHNRSGEPCYVCETPLAAIHHGERQTTYCPTCQVGGRVYADRRLSRLLRWRGRSGERHVEVRRPPVTI